MRAQQSDDERETSDDNHGNLPQDIGREISGVAAPDLMTRETHVAKPADGHPIAETNKESQVGNGQREKMNPRLS